MSTAIGVSLPRLATAVGKAVSEYAVLGKTPGFTADFIKNKYPSYSSFASAITHSRSGNATMTDGYGPELVVNGGFDSDLSNWTGSGWVWTSKGAFDSGSGVTSDLEQDITVESGKTYLIRLQLREISGGSPSIKDGSTVLQQVSSDDFYDIAYIADSSTLELKIQGGNATFYVDNVSVREMPVLKWAPHNLLTYSEDFSNAAWAKNAVDVTANAITAPDGSSTAEKVTVNAAANPHYVRDNSTNSTNQQSTIAVFAKAAEYDYIALYAGTVGKGKYFNISTGAVLGDLISAPDDARITDVGNGWYLCEIDVNASANEAVSVYLSDTGSQFNFLGDGSSGVYLWGIHFYRSDLGGMVDNPDQPPSRASYVPTALRPFGANLVTNGTFDTDSDWTKGTGWTISNGVATHSETAGAGALSQELTWEVGKVYSVKATIDTSSDASLNPNTSLGIRNNAETSNLATLSLDASSNKTYELTFVATETNSKIWIYAADNILSVDSVIVRESSVNPTAARYLPRIGHHVYNGSAWVNEGLLAESEARTNILPKSGEFSTWGTQVKVTVTDDAVISPDGTQSASTVVPTTVSGEHYVEYSLTADTGTFTDSAYVKADGYKRVFIRPVHVGATEGATQIIEFNVEAGTVLNAPSGTIGTIQDVGNGWYRIAATYTVSGTITGSYGFRVQIADNSGIGNYAGDGTSGIQIYGAQREQASTPSSLIPTSGSSVTRAAETFTIPSANLPWPSPNYIGSELVTNGDGSSTTNWSAARSNSTLTVTGGRLRATANNAGAYGPVQTLTGLTIGNVYQAKADVFTGGGSGSFYFRVVAASDLNATSPVNEQTSVDKSISVEFVATATTMYVGGINVASAGGDYIELDNISVREINPLSVSIAMDGRMTYADTDDANEGLLYRWHINFDNRLQSFLSTAGTRTGQMNFFQEESNVQDSVATGNDYYTTGILTPFDIASRHGSTFVNGATEGVVLTANTTPTALVDLSSTDMTIAHVYMGTIGTFRVWDRDIGDTGLVEATNPSLEPSLSLDFLGTGTTSFTVSDWSE